MTNIEKLARLIVRTGNADKIMKTLPLLIQPREKEEGAA